VIRSFSRTELRERRWIAIVAALSIGNLLAFCAPAPESNGSASQTRCEFGPGQSLGNIVNSPAFDGGPTLSGDETELFFTSERKGQQDLFVATRPNRAAPWTEPVNLGAPIDDPTAGDFSLRLSSEYRYTNAAGNPVVERNRYLDVWTRRDGRWQLVATQATLIQADSSR
jgi:hypothetical protein